MPYTLAELKQDVAAGTIDTVLVAFPDIRVERSGFMTKSP